MDRVEAAYHKMLALAGHTNKDEYNAALIELMITVMELTEEKLNAVHERVRREALDETHLAQMAVIRLRGSLKQLEGGLNITITDLRSS